ncbi:MAG: hypothetical protein RIS70_2637 [Planctomycetota bacterium]|jgi:hypothetical protein
MSMADMGLLDVARKQIEFAREYTWSLISDIADVDWYRTPAGSPTHVAWQVGHLAMAEYGLCLFRQRGRAEVDTSLMSSSFRKQFSRGSQPSADATGCPSPAEIRDVFQRVHEQVRQELPTFSESQLNEVVEMPYAALPTKLGALLFCSHHEMLHAGQIGVLRRMLGLTPVR